MARDRGENRRRNQVVKKRPVKMRLATRPQNEHEREEPPLHAVEAPPSPAAELSASVQAPTRLGFYTVIALVVALGGWAGNAILASAAYAPGVVKPEGERRSVQHLEGGIVKRILVADGDRVAVGDPLVELDDVPSVADFKTKLGQRLALETLEAALQAELDGRESVSFDRGIEAAADEDPELKRIVENQRSQFEARRQAFLDRTAVLGQQKRQTEAEIDGLSAVVTSAERRLALNAEETKSVEALFAKGLARRSRVLELQGLGAQLEGDIQRTRAEIARAEQQIGEIELRLVELKSARRDEAARELADVRARLLTARNAERTSADVLERTVLRAPVDGVVIGLRHHTVGAVADPGSVLLEVIPDREQLIVEAKVSPTDRDTVWIGQDAQVVFTAFKQDEAPPVDGEVIHIAADRTEDDRTGELYFVAKVVVDPDQMALIGGEEALTPGMPADVLFKRGDRTVLAYLVEPFTDAIGKAFREE